MKTGMSAQHSREEEKCWGVERKRCSVKKGVKEKGIMGTGSRVGNQGEGSKGGHD